MQKSINTDILTLTRHLTSLQQKHADAHGDFTLLVQSIQMACKFVSSKVRKAGITNLYGIAGQENATGDVQKKLDVIANEVFVNSLKSSHKCCIMISEENETPIEVDIKDSASKYVVAFDPLDGSSNIDANVSIGSIFAIWKRVTDSGKPITQEDMLQNGNNIVCAGYCCYGSATQLVMALGNQVYCYTLDPSIGEFILTHENMKCPKKGAIYSVNEGNSQNWDNAIKTYVDSKKNPPEGKKAYSLRYVGSMVADVHRTILYGGIFLYPADKKSPNGKLRILYESYPMAYILEKAGGKAITGNDRILDIKAKKIHDRCPVILGSADDVDEVAELYKNLKK